MKLKLFKRMMALCMTGALMLTSLAGCGGDTANGGGESNGGGKADAGSLVVTVAKLGFGDQWLMDLAKAYEEKTGTSVEVISKVGDSGLSAIKGELQSQVSESDIYFTRLSEYFKSIYKGSVSIGGTNYDCEFAELTDVWNATAEGEDKTIAEKVDADFEAYHNVDGKYYGLPWAKTIMGIVRNKNVWESLGLTEEDIPLTTDEMFALCDTVKGQGVAPFIYSLESEYYSSIAPIWFGQYEGTESMQNFYNGLDPVGENSSNLYAYDGQVKTLEVVERIINKDNGYQHAMSDSASFTDMQSTFLLDQALFCVNGSWLEVEMGENYANANIDFIKTPIISSIIEKLPTVNDDATLSAVVAYVDGLTDSAPAGVSEDDIAVVRDARNFSYSGGGYDHIAVIPAYSDNVDTAKDFLKFMYSDDGLDIYYKATGGTQLPVASTRGYTSEVELTTFRQNINEIMAEGLISDYDAQVKNKIYAIGGVNRYWYNGSSNVVRELLDGKTPEEICAVNNNYLEANWSSMSNY